MRRSRVPVANALPAPLPVFSAAADRTADALVERRDASECRDGTTAVDVAGAPTAGDGPAAAAAAAAAPTAAPSGPVRREASYSRRAATTAAAAAVADRLAAARRERSVSRAVRDCSWR